jgi:urea transport system ATP-binding protein
METSKIITRIAQDITTIVIEHDIKFLKQIGQNVTVMHQGSVLVEGTFNEIANMEQVRNVYLGRKR